ncbi:MAG TPA: hypothetical protein VGQ38_15015 [Gaiellaceae bacterium]|nr:hypothetical protein [Gaiellaceae bacterium]
MHAEQQPLESDVEQIWLAACGDAGQNLDECLLYVLDGAESERGFGGMHFQRVLHIYESEHLGGDSGRRGVRHRA